MEQDLSTAAAIGQEVAGYGVTGAIGVLCISVVYLYRQVSAMSQRIQDVVERYAADIRELAVASQRTISENTSAFLACKSTVDRVESSLASRSREV